MRANCTVSYRTNERGNYRLAVGWFGYAIRGTYSGKQSLVQRLDHGTGCFLAIHSDLAQAAVRFPFGPCSLLASLPWLPRK
jgi:hypothetical protein